MRIPLTFTLLIVLACASAACSNGGGGPVVYPNGWPYPDIKAPIDSTRAKFPSNVDLGRRSKDGYTIDGIDFGDGKKLYAVVFKHGGTWDELHDIINSQAEQAGLKELKTNPYTFMWVEPDKATLGDSNIVRLDVIGQACFQLSIDVK